MRRRLRWHHTLPKFTKMNHQGAKEMPKAMVSHHNDINTWKTCKKWKNTKVALVLQKGALIRKGWQSFFVLGPCCSGFFGFQQDDADSDEGLLSFKRWTSRWYSNDTFLPKQVLFYHQTVPTLKTNMEDANLQLAKTTIISSKECSTGCQDYLMIRT